MDFAETVIAIRIRHPLRIAPQRRSVETPITTECPTRQGLARIPFALSKMEETARRKIVAQALEKISGNPELGRPKSGGVPFVAIHVVDRNEGGLASHREPHVTSS